MTNRELLMMLDGDLGERAVKNCIEYHSDSGESYLMEKREDVSNALHGAFAWDKTIEGHDFWCKVYYELIDLGL